MANQDIVQEDDEEEEEMDDVPDALPDTAVNPQVHHPGERDSK